MTIISNITYYHTYNRQAHQLLPIPLVVPCIAKGTRTLRAEIPPPADGIIFAHLQAKHHDEDREDIAAAAAAVADAPTGPTEDTASGH